jgi:hypothetical protein
MHGVNFNKAADHVNMVGCLVLESNFLRQRQVERTLQEDGHLGTIPAFSRKSAPLSSDVLRDMG